MQADVPGCCVARLPTACLLALVLSIQALSATAAPLELASQDSACGLDGVESCLDASFGDSVLQTRAIRERVATATGASGKLCKKLCRNARWVKWGTSWDEKCAVKQCEGCSECAGGPAPATPAPEPPSPATPVPAPPAPAPPTVGPPRGPSGGECKNACRSDRFTKWGDTWPEKCQVKQCSGCAECAGGASAPTEAANHTGKTSLGEIRSGEPLEVAAPSFHGWATASYSLFAPPAGLSVNRRTGKLTWQPDASQAGDHSVELDAIDGGGSGERRRHTLTVRVVAAGGLADGIYVWPSGGSDTSGRGTAAKPFKTLQKATAGAKPGDLVFIRGGTYRLKLQALDNVKGSAPHPVVITRLPGERVYILPHKAGERTTFGFSVGKGCVGLAFRGLELDGEAWQNDVWSIVRKNWWRVEGGTFDVLGGANGFSIDGQHITVEDCVIHDCWSKAVDIPEGRYITLRGNVIYNVGQYTVVGGAGIHRKWELNYKDPDDPRYYRFDISGNLIFNVEQRIPSFLPSKGFSDLVFDEGNSIGIWVTKDKQTKTRVANNAVLFPGKTGIHIMDNPNTEVLNNLVLTEQGRTDPVPRGIECPDRYGVDTTLTVKRNLVHSYPGGRAFAVSGHFAAEDSPVRVDGNYYSGGGELKDVPPAFKGTGDAPGIHNVSGSVFVNHAGLDLRPRADLPQDTGVDPSVLARLFALAADHGVVVAPSGWRHDHVRMVDAILAAAPKNHVSGPKLAPSKKHKKHGREAYWYDVKSSFYRRLCKCSKLELIPSTSYWDHKLRKMAESSG